MKIGLTLGKFTPLHKGHQLMIETALREMDQLYVLVYDSLETSDIPLNRRADWIRTLYPQVKVIEGWNSPSDAGYTKEIMEIQDRYILKMAGHLGVTHFYSSEPYGHHVSKALGAINRQVDIPRAGVNISGTAIRADIYAHRHFLADLVYRDHITNVVFVGAESTGKTTIAEMLAREFNTAWMPEYGREYWEKNQQNLQLAPEQLVELATGHLEREDNMLLEARNILFTDTNALTTRIFSYFYHGSAHPELEKMADRCVLRYHHYFLCDTDIPYEDTWDRTGAANRLKMQQMIIDDLKARQIEFTILRGSLSERMQAVGRILEFRKNTRLKECRKGPSWS